MSAQSIEALAGANQVKADRKAIARLLAAGELTIGEAMTAECVWTLPVSRLLAFLPWWGDARARQLLGPLGVNADAMVGSLTDRQRALVATALDRELARRKAGRRR